MPEYTEYSMYGAIKQAAEKYPDETAYDFYGRRTSFSRFIEKIDTASAALYALGIRAGDRVSVAMPNTPQALDCIYALNRLGATANMIHPLCAPEDLRFALTLSGSKLLLTADLFLDKAERVIKENALDVRLIAARMQDELPLAYKAAYMLKKGKALHGSGLSRTV